jgi:hypothetical protein
MPSSYDAEEAVDLSPYDEIFARAETSRPPDPNQEIPDGNYDTVIEEVRLTRTSRTNTPMVVFRLRILGPDCSGRRLTKTRVITEKTIPYLKQDLEQCGLQIHRLSELQAHLKELEEIPMPVYKRTRGEFSDVFFQRSRRGSAAAVAGGAGLDDDLPF